MRRIVDVLPSRQFRVRASIGIAAFLVLFTIIGFLIVPPIVKSVAMKKLSDALHREVTIEKVRVNPFALSVDVQGVKIKERSGAAPFVSFDRLYLNFEIVSIFKGGLVLKEIDLEKPYVNISLKEDGTYNFSDLLLQEKPPAGKPARPLRFSLNNIRIRNGSIDFLDGTKKTRHTVRDLLVDIPFLSNLPYYVDTYVQPALEAKVNDRPVAFKGMTKPFTDSLETSFDVKIKDFDIPYYLVYVPFPLNVGIPSGLLDVNAVVAYTQYRNREPSLVVSGNVDLKNIAVDDKTQSPILRLPLLSVSLAASDLMARKIHFSKILFQEPVLTVARNAAGVLSIENLLPQNEKGGKAPQEAGQGKKKEPSPVVVVADEIRIKAGTFSFSDMPNGRPFKTTLAPIDLSVDQFSNEREKKAVIALSLKTEADESLAVKGTVSVEPMATEGTVEVKKVSLRKYSPYYSSFVLFMIEEGSLDFSTAFTAAKGERDVEVSLSSLSATLSALRLKKSDDKEDFLAIPVAGVRDASVDLAKKELTLGEISTSRGSVVARRLADGSINLQSLIPSSQAAGPPTTAAGKGKSAQPDQKVKEKPWLISVKSLSVDRYAVRFDDLVPPEPVTVRIDDIKVRGNGISTAKNRKGKAAFSCSLNKNGAISASGAVGVDPPSAELKASIKGVEIAPFQPYLADRVKIVISDGHVIADGNLGFSYEEKTGMKASYRGEASITQFYSVDRALFEDFLKWESLYFSGIDVSYSPLLVSINEVALTDFYSRLIINQDGSLNVQGIMEEKKPQGEASSSPAPAQTIGAAAPPVTPAPQKMVKIEKVTLQGGTVNFSDRHIKPNYSANLLEIGGRVSGLSSEESKFADVNLKGKLDNYAPLEITGKINPLRDDLFVDLAVDFKDMDLSPVTPYSGRYMGYTIQKGKLSLALKYLIVKKKLDSQNRVFLDQFTLGEKVESPDATKLPVKLAIALLKNRKGEITLDIPVSGQIDDPKFSLGGIIIKIILNLLVKAATSPFALLGAIFGGGGEELSYLDFDYGLSAIGPEGTKKLDNLVKALADRPALKLEIEGHVDMEKDKEGLRQYIFQKKIRTQKLKDMVKKGLAAVPVDEVKVEPNEYPVYLKMAYKEENFPKPRNIIGMAKDLPVPEMEKLMLTHIEAKENELRGLASERALKVRDYVLKSKQVEPERVFLVEPKTLAPEKKEKMKDSRVDFRLK